MTEPQAGQGSREEAWRVRLVLVSVVQQPPTGIGLLFWHSPGQRLPPPLQQSARLIPQLGQMVLVYRRAKNIPRHLAPDGLARLVATARCQLIRQSIAQLERVFCSRSSWPWAEKATGVGPGSAPMRPAHPARAHSHVSVRPARGDEKGVNRFMAVTHRLKKGAPPRDSCRRSGRPAETSELDVVECPFLRQELAVTETASGASVEYAPEEQHFLWTRKPRP